MRHWPAGTKVWSEDGVAELQPGEGGDVQGGGASNGDLPDECAGSGVLRISRDKDIEQEVGVGIQPVGRKLGQRVSGRRHARSTPAAGNPTDRAVRGSRYTGRCRS